MNAVTNSNLEVKNLSVAERFNAGPEYFDSVEEYLRFETNIFDMGALYLNASNVGYWHMAMVGKNRDIFVMYPQLGDSSVPTLTSWVCDEAEEMPEFLAGVILTLHSLLHHRGWAKFSNAKFNEHYFELAMIGDAHAREMGVEKAYWKCLGAPLDVMKKSAEQLVIAKILPDEGCRFIKRLSEGEANTLTTAVNIFSREEYRIEKELAYVFGHLTAAGVFLEMHGDFLGDTTIQKECDKHYELLVNGRDLAEKLNRSSEYFMLTD